MNKELIICIVIIVFVFFIDGITGKYTKECVNDLKNDLYQISNKIDKRENKKELLKSIESLKDKWKKEYEKLAYYIEHDELEKIYLYIVGTESGIKCEEYTQTVEEIDKCMYILEHVEEKYRFNLKNIF